MSLIKKPNELEIPTHLNILLYGVPGCGKTTLALSAPNPVLIDIEGGVRRVRGDLRTDTVQLTNWTDLRDLMRGNDLDAYETIIIDPLGKLIDMGLAYAIKTSPKAAKNTQAAFGEVLMLFQQMYSLLDSKRKSLIFICHSTEKIVNDAKDIRIAVAGQTKERIMSDMDIVGYLYYNKENKIEINFEGNSEFFTKDKLRIGKKIIPQLNHNNDWLQKNVFDVNKKLILEEAALREKYHMLLELHQFNINELKTAEDINTYYSEVYHKAENIWGIHTLEANLLKAKAKELCVEFDKNTKQFIHMGK